VAVPTTAKKMRDTLKVMYGSEKNPSRVFEIYMRLFELKQGDKSVAELEMHVTMQRH